MVVENGAIGFVPNFLNSPWQARSMDARHSTGTNRGTPHSYGNGEQESEGVVVGMVPGSADACVFMVV